ncbi:hypothetical protein PG993_011440 [Apiospora rasikravindrae]|uniref:NAD(P)-binding domain-containing protein n=1 Tax=Apiospora rasikravindrae TaxID=990691 RepID=A0ABR1SG16_9PEZI
MSNEIKTVAFFGASGGTGLSALKYTLKAGHQCIALCRYPAKLTSLFPPETTPNLRVVEGNAKNPTDVTKCLLKSDGTSLIDEIVFTVGAKPILHKLAIDDPSVCRVAMACVLQAVADLRNNRGATGRPHIVACSTTGMSKHGRDYPIALWPIYGWMLKVPHEDKHAMEEALRNSGETYTIMRPSLLTDGETDKPIRVGVEDFKEGRLSKAIGYTISREDTGKWIAQHLLLQKDANYVNKAVMVTY